MAFCKTCRRSARAATALLAPLPAIVQAEAGDDVFDRTVRVVDADPVAGTLDTEFLGFGGESYAYSNDAHPLFGRPSFDEAKFAVDTDARITISLE